MEMTQHFGKIPEFNKIKLLQNSADATDCQKNQS